MSRTDDLRILLDLAMLTEDRTDAEQKAMLRVADQLDFAHNALVVRNAKAQAAPDWQPSRLYDRVLATRELDDGQRHVELPKRKGVWPRRD